MTGQRVALFLKDSNPSKSSLLSMIHKDGILGKSLGADVLINDYRLSGIHAYMEVIENSKKIHLVDLGSRTGIYVNGKAVQEAELNDGESFVIGGSEIQIQFPDVNLELLDFLDLKSPNEIPADKGPEKAKSQMRVENEQTLLQASLYWGQKCLEVRTFEGGSEITVGSEKSATFDFSMGEERLYRIARYSNPHLELFLPERARGIVWKGTDVLPVHQLRSGVDPTLKLRIGDRADIQFDELTLSFQFVPPAIPVKRHVIPRLNRNLIVILGILFATYFGIFTILSFSKLNSNKENGVIAKAPERLRRVFYEAGIKSADRVRESAIGELSETGGRARSEEGASQSQAALDSAKVKAEILREKKIDSAFESVGGNESINTVSLIAPKQMGQTMSALASRGQARGRVGLGAGGGGQGVGVGQLKGLDTGGGQGAGDFGLKPSLGQEITLGQTEEILVDGGLEADVIAAVIQRYLPQIRHCYETRLISIPDLKGKVLVKFNIVASGAVSLPQIIETSIKDPITEKCILEKIMSWKFPKPKGGSTVGVKYPFILMSTRQ